MTLSKKKILAITLARGGSKGVRKKNIKKIAGYPLIYYTIIEALKSKLINRYIVSTDDTIIQKISKKYGAEAPFLRPKNLSTDKASSVAALQHCVKWAEKNDNIQYDYVIELMCTNPLKNHFDIDSSLNKLISTKADSVIAVNRILDQHPLRVKKIVKDRIVNFCLKEKKESRRQDLKPFAYLRSGSIYALNRNYLMRKNERYGSKNSRPYFLPESRTINIDNRNDFLLAEILLNNRKK